MSWWKVKKELDHGGLIFGRRRKLDDLFEAPDTAMAHQAMEGIVEKADAPLAKAQPSSTGKSADTGKAAADVSSGGNKSAA